MYKKIIVISTLLLNYTLHFSCTFVLRNSGAFVGEIKDKSMIEKEKYCDLKEKELFSRNTNTSFKYRNLYHEIGHNTGNIIDYILIFAILFDYPYRLVNYLISLFYLTPIAYDNNKDGKYYPPPWHPYDYEKGWVKFEIKDCTQDKANLFILELENVCPQQLEKTIIYDDFILSDSLSLESIELNNSYFYDKFIEINSLNKKDMKKIQYLIGNPDTYIRKTIHMCKTLYAINYSGGITKLLEDLKTEANTKSKH